MFVRVLSPFQDRGAGNTVEAPMDSLAPKAKVKRSRSWSEIESVYLVTGYMRLHRLPAPTGELLLQRKTFVIQSLTLVCTEEGGSVVASCLSAVDHEGLVPRSALVGGTPSLWTDANTFFGRRLRKRVDLSPPPLSSQLFTPFTFLLPLVCDRESHISHPWPRPPRPPLPSPSTTTPQAVCKNSAQIGSFWLVATVIAEHFGAFCRVQVLVSSRYVRALLYVKSYLPLPHGVCRFHGLIFIHSPPSRARNGLRFTGSELRWRFAA
ncbi:hypothetical protein B0H14DRAFT_3889212 [Mycena olivaceomarginata]|nr:hypothetical protein B0H14DRAFT_3889212 [Mycena olivaceomarginata]